MELHLTTIECHLPYEITHSYLSLDTTEHTSLNLGQTGWCAIIMLNELISFC